MKVDEMVQGAQEAMTVKRVYGDPIERDGALFIPVAKVRGMGGVGGDEAGNGGGGFGVTATPAGMYMIKGGDAVWRPAVDVNRMALMGQVVAIVALLVLRSIVKARSR
jgi:uncharacterized spore protein YtfJ